MVAEVPDPDAGEPVPASRPAEEEHDPSGPLTMGFPAYPGVGARTIGVAVEVPEPWGEQLRRQREDFGDPLGPVVPTHVTLLPPTVIPAMDLDAVVAHLTHTAASGEPFELRLEGTGTFRPVSPVVFVNVVAGGEQCDALQQLVRTGPLARSLAFPYHPHVTVAQQLDDATLDRAMETLQEFAAAFPVDEFCLYEHGADERWRPTRRFPLGMARP